jgi:hypothetical protein
MLKSSKRSSSYEIILNHNISDENGAKFSLIDHEDEADDSSYTNNLSNDIPIQRKSSQDEEEGILLIDAKTNEDDNIINNISANLATKDSPNLDIFTRNNVSSGSILKKNNSRKQIQFNLEEIKNLNNSTASHLNLKAESTTKSLLINAAASAAASKSSSKLSKTQSKGFLNRNTSYYKAKAQNEEADPLSSNMNNIYNRRNTSIGGSTAFNLADLLNQLKLSESRRKKEQETRHHNHHHKTNLLLKTEHKSNILQNKKFKKNLLIRFLLSFNNRMKLTWNKFIMTLLQIAKFIERPYEHNGGLVYSIFKFTIILFSIILGSLTTLPSNQTVFTGYTYYIITDRVFFWYELSLSIYLLLEYLLFIWSIGLRLGFKGVQGRVRFIRRSPLLILEASLTPINLAVLLLVLKYDYNQVTSVLRCIQILRLLFIDRYAQTWKLLLKVVYKHRFELITCFYIGTIMLLISSYLILIFEKEESIRLDDNHFQSYADALYWSIITMTTIGYGDRSPRTFYGKIVATTLCIIGVAFWTLPGGIIGSGFAFKIEENNRKNQMNRLFPAAATLIQSWWRMKATINVTPESTSCLIATISTFNLSKPIYSSSLRRLKKNLDSTNGQLSEEVNMYFSGLDPKPNHKSNSGGNHVRSFSESEADNPNHQNIQIITEHSLESENTATTMPLISSHDSSYSQSNSNHQKNAAILMQLSPEHWILIRTILIMKYFAARNKFKLAFKPYDFKDVIDQYKQGNTDILIKIKDLHRKLEQINYITLSAYTNNLFTNEQNFNGRSANRGETNNGSLTPKQQSNYNNPNLARSLSPMMNLNGGGPNYSRRFQYIASPPSPKTPPSPQLFQHQFNTPMNNGVFLRNNKNSSSKLNRFTNSYNSNNYFTEQPLLNSNYVLETQSSNEAQQQISQDSTDSVLNERLNKLESTIESLNSKLDILLTNR